MIRADINYIRIESWTNIQDRCIVHVTGGTSPTEIGDNVTVGHGAILYGCRIGKNCLTRMKAIIFDDVVVEDDSIIAAGTVVESSTEIPSGMLAAGNPAVVKRQVSKLEADCFIDWASQYREYAGRY